jgi:hypothetical protein
MHRFSSQTEWESNILRVSLEIKLDLINVSALFLGVNYTAAADAPWPPTGN